MSFANRLTELRKEKGMTQNELAELIGVSRGTIGMYEIGKRDPDTSTIEKLCNIFNVSSDYLLGRSNIRNPYEKEDFQITPEEKEFLEKIKSDSDLNILFHDLKNAPKKKIKQLLKTWKFIQEEFHSWEDKERNNK